MIIILIGLAIYAAFTFYCIAKARDIDRKLYRPDKWYN